MSYSKFSVDTDTESPKFSDGEIKKRIINKSIAINGKQNFKKNTIFE